MQPTADRRSTMSTAAQMTIRARGAASALFERERRKTGSRMAAYENVAAMVGASASWLRKFINGSHEVKQPDWTVGWNILAVYERVCTHVEAKNEARRRKIERREEATHAAISCAVAGRDVDIPRPALAPAGLGGSVPLAGRVQPPLSGPPAEVTDEMEIPWFLRRS